MEEQVFIWELFKDQLQAEKAQKELESKFKVKPKKVKKSIPKKVQKKVGKLTKKKRVSTATSNDMLKLLETMQF